MSVPLPITNSVLRVVHIHAALCAGALFSSPGSNQCENWWECVMLTWCEIKVNIYTYLMWGQNKSSEVTARNRFILLYLIISHGRLSSGLMVCPSPYQAPGTTSGSQCPTDHSGTPSFTSRMRKARGADHPIFWNVTRKRPPKQEQKVISRAKDWWFHTKSDSELAKEPMFDRACENWPFKMKTRRVDRPCGCKSSGSTGFLDTN